MYVCMYKCVHAWVIDIPAKNSQLLRQKPRQRFAYNCFYLQLYVYNNNNCNEIMKFRQFDYCFCQSAANVNLRAFWLGCIRCRQQRIQHRDKGYFYPQLRMLSAKAERLCVCMCGCVCMRWISYALISHLNRMEWNGSALLRCG